MPLYKCYSIGMALELIIGLAVFAFVSSITPGPNNIMLLTSGVNYGFARTIPHMLGVSLGFYFMVACLGLGLSGLLQLYPRLLDYLKIFAFAYLIYLSWRIAFSKSVSSDAKSTSRPMSFIEACLFQWINPKAVIMALTALSLYVDQRNPLFSLFLVGFIFTVINLPSVSVWVVFGVSLRKFLSDPRRLRIFNFAMGALLILSIIPIVFA